MKRFQSVASAALLALASAAAAHEYTVGDIIVGHPMAFETHKTARAGGGYLTLTNTGDAPDRLIAVSSDTYPNVSLHLSETSAEGVARMTELEGIVIPAGETVTLEPGGAHVMFMGLKADPFQRGDEIPATLTFEHGGDLEVLFIVEERRRRGTRADHSGHDAHTD